MFEIYADQSSLTCRFTAYSKVVGTLKVSHTVNKMCRPVVSL